VASVQQQLTKLMKQNSQLVDKFNAAKIDVTNKTKAAAAAKSAAAAASAAFENAREAVSATALAEYQGGAFSTAGALLSGSSQQSYLESLNTQSMISAHTAAVARQLDASKSAADQATKKANALLKAATARRDALAKQKADLDKRFADYSKLLATLTAAQQRTYQRSFSTTPSVAQVAMIKTTMVVGGVAGAAQKAVDFALAQTGKPYVYGAAGPDSFDCSGLTMAAYASAGISLPHSAADQYNYGRHIQYSSAADLVTKLKPGDLIFYYSPIGHVAMYVGGGQAMSASTEGVPLGLIDVAGWDANQITGATRIVG
jgi:cell wall-associated NlpC family hydrolase